MKERYEIVSKVGYYIGIDKKYFREGEEGLSIALFKELEKKSENKLIRDLCICRGQIFHNFKKIKDAWITGDVRSLLTMTEYIPSDTATNIYAAKVDITKRDLNEIVVSINKMLSERLNLIKPVFPQWIHWEYLRDCFLMPGGFKKENLLDTVKKFYNQMDLYPYKQYINLPMKEENGMILHSDRVFCRVLYEAHNDEFQDRSKVMDITEEKRTSIHEWLDAHEKTVCVIDSENSDPFSVSAAMKGLAKEYQNKIEKIILVDDKSHTSTAWRDLQKFTSIPVERFEYDRLIDGKSMADLYLTSTVMKLVYKESVDGILLVSSDSDFWALVNALPEADFLFMVQHEKVGSSLLNILAEHNIQWVYIDDFYDGGGNDMLTTVLVSEIYKKLEPAINLNLKSMLAEVLWDLKVELSPQEKDSFYNAYLKDIHLVVNKESGECRIVLGNR